jgi:hypothetical protein
MLATDVEKLHWCGIDMRPRWRRRVAVVATYAMFLFVVWWHPRWTYGAVEGLWLVWFLSTVWSMVAETEWPARVVFTALWALILGVQVWESRGKVAVGMTVLNAAWLVAFASVLSWSGMAAKRDAGWLAEAISKGESLGWKQQRRLARMGFAVGLDGFAWYEFTKRFERLNEKERAEVEKLRRANPRGRWMRGGERVLLDDERVRQEDNVLRAKVQRVMNWVLVLTALGVSVAVAQGWTVRGTVAIAGAWTLATLMITLRQAIVLWSEEDPRGITTELALVEGEA